MHVIVTLLKELLSGWKINQSTTSPQGCISLTFSRSNFPWSSLESATCHIIVHCINIPYYEKGTKYHGYKKLYEISCKVLWRNHTVGHCIKH